MTDSGITISRSYSGKFILTGDRHSSSFLNPSTSSRYVSQVSFSSFIFCTCIAHHFTILKPSFCRSISSSLRRAIKFKTHFGINIKSLDLNFRLNQTPFAHPKHWSANRKKHPLRESGYFQEPQTGYCWFQFHSSNLASNNQSECPILLNFTILP